MKIYNTDVIISIRVIVNTDKLSHTHKTWSLGGGNNWNFSAISNLDNASNSRYLNFTEKPGS